MAKKGGKASEAYKSVPVKVERVGVIVLAGDQDVDNLYALAADAHDELVGVEQADLAVDIPGAGVARGHPGRRLEERRRVRQRGPSRTVEDGVDQGVGADDEGEVHLVHAGRRRRRVVLQGHEVRLRQVDALGGEGGGPVDGFAGGHERGVARVRYDT